ncbi:hypothetical protein KB879_33905 (plasmid) [Cupriavidus sp. KK10]|uniref:hypothetical protein n=1 Tax=Cupriavidus sp. KK10 TaxID=1478019 RepID=UPI001BA78306|nr:hypothetical protein [Cupriavidus sp. KK10]QUN32600.1 hypothetical protein KB879_33905 [Cupriavidus sp. KK10]
MELEQADKAVLPSRDTGLRRMLSAHEVGMLLRLSSAPVGIDAASPDLIALQDLGLVRVIGVQFTLTAAGRIVVERLARY